MTKTCRDCNETKDINDFYRNRKSADGRLGRCKTCQDLANARVRERPEGALNQRTSNHVSRLASQVPLYRETKDGPRLAAERMHEELRAISSGYRHLTDKGSGIS